MVPRTVFQLSESVCPIYPAWIATTGWPGIVEHFPMCWIAHQRKMPRNRSVFFPYPASPHKEYWPVIVACFSRILGHHTEWYCPVIVACFSQILDHHSERTLPVIIACFSQILYHHTQRILPSNIILVCFPEMMDHQTERILPSRPNGSVFLQYNTIQYNTIQYNTIQYNTIQYIAPKPKNLY